MSHRTDLPSGAYAFHNGDFSGDVRINLDASQVERVDLASYQVSIDFEDVKALVAAWVRSQAIERLEQISDNELLIGAPRIEELHTWFRDVAREEARRYSGS